MKKIINSLFLSSFAILLIGSFIAPVAYADNGNGWIEVQVSVPENFSDQIYIQFQEYGKTEEAFYDNFVQILPENNYTGRIELPVGKYEVTCMNTYENPLIYNVELDSTIEYPIVVTDDKATLVKFNCTPVPIEELPEIEGQYPQEILDAAQKASDEKNEKVEVDIESGVNENDLPSNDLTESYDTEDEKSEKQFKQPLFSIIRGIFSTVAFIMIFGSIGYFTFKSKNR